MVVTGVVTVLPVHCHHLFVLISSYDVYYVKSHAQFKAQNRKTPKNPLDLVQGLSKYFVGRCLQVRQAFNAPLPFENAKPPRHETSDHKGRHAKDPMAGPMAEGVSTPSDQGIKRCVWRKDVGAPSKARYCPWAQACAMSRLRGENTCPLWPVW